MRRECTGRVAGGVLRAAEGGGGSQGAAGGEKGRGGLEAGEI